MSSKKRPIWRGYEERKVEQYGAVYKGGPGKPDGIRDNGILFPPDHFEVKRWERKMNTNDVKGEISKGRTIIISRSGFTDDAIDFANHHNFSRILPIKLVHGNTRVA